MHNSAPLHVLRVAHDYPDKVCLKGSGTTPSMALPTANYLFKNELAQADSIVNVLFIINLKASLVFEDSGSSEFSYFSFT